MRVRVYSHFQRQTWEGNVPDEHCEPGTPDNYTSRVNELLFRCFNRVDREDADRLEDWGYELPSLSVHDVITWNGRSFQVQPTGFTEITG